jgi:hypothetical protein
MSKLTFSRTDGNIILTGADNKIVGAWSAHNRTITGSNGPWPNGTYRWSHFNPHPEAGFLPAALHGPYGSTGIHIFSVSGRPGIGVHAGRTFGQPFAVGGVTLGCIRVPAEAMQTINATHGRDHLREITVS